MRLFLVLMSGLVVAVPSWGQEPSGAVLDARIDALEQRFEDHRTDAREMRSARRTEAATEFENVRSEMSTRVWAFSIVIGLLLLFIGVGGSILTFLGRRWIADQIDERAGAAVSERLTAERVREMLREQSQPVIDAAMESRMVVMDERIDAISDEMKSSAEKRIQEVSDEIERLGAKLISEQRGAEENSGGQAETLGRMLESAKPDRSKWSFVNWMTHGIQLREEGDFEEALVAFERAILLVPENGSARVNQGFVLNELGRHEEALGALDRAVALAPDNGAAHNNRGSALNDLGRHEEALGALDRAVELLPDNGVAHSNRGHALNELGRHEEALAALDRAVELLPDNGGTHSNRGDTLNALGRHEEALSALDRAEELGLDHPAPRYHRAAAYIGLGRYEEAVPQAAEALAICEGLVDADYRRSLSLYFKIVASLLSGANAEADRVALGEVLGRSFPQSLGRWVYDEPLTEDAGVQAEIDAVSAMMRAHDAAR